MPGDSDTPSPSQAAVNSVQKLRSAILETFPQPVAEFEKRWDACIDACVHTPEYDALKKLGPKVIPLVVSKIADDPQKNSRGVFLYNDLEPFSDYRPSQENPQIPDQLRQDAAQIIELNCTRNKEAEDRIKAWMDHYEANRPFHSNTAIYTECDEYYDLLGMDQGIIAHLMVAYSNYPGAFFYELLHDLTHGRKMGAHAVNKGVCFEAWKRWFNEGEHDDRPKYIPTEADRKIFGDKVADFH